MNKNKEKLKKAVGITYEDDLRAPIVSSKGQGFVAEKIIEKAQETGVTTYFDEDLLESLMAISIGDEIPVELYEIVAKVLAFIEKIDNLNHSNVKK